MARRAHDLLMSQVDKCEDGVLYELIEKQTEQMKDDTAHDLLMAQVDKYEDRVLYAMKEKNEQMKDASPDSEIRRILQCHVRVLSGFHKQLVDYRLLKVPGLNFCPNKHLNHFFHNAQSMMCTHMWETEYMIADGSIDDMLK